MCMYFQTYFYLLVLLVLASLDLTISFRRRLRALHSDGEQLESLRLVRGRARAGHVDDLRRAPGSVLRGGTHHWRRSEGGWRRRHRNLHDRVGGAHDVGAVVTFYNSLC